MTRLLLAGWLCLAITCSASATTTSPLPRSTPEAQGVSSAELLRFVEAADAKVDTMNSFMLLRHGYVVAEGWWSPYHAETPHVLYSLTKSFTSTAVGLAQAEGKLSIDDTVLSFFPEDAPADASANLKTMRLRDLLRMSSGQHAEDVEKVFNPFPSIAWTKAFLAIPVAHKPGTHFWYNSPGSYMLSAAVQKATGQTIHDYLVPRLFEPLGIENPIWSQSPQGVSIGGHGLSLRTEEIARFGLLLLQKGQWHGKQLVPAEWIAQATAVQTANGSNPTSDWEQGYGFQFWRCRHGFFRGDGAFGQFCIVMPQYDAAVIITSGTRDMQTVMNLVWDHVVPALKPAALAPDTEDDARLKDRLANLSVRVLDPGTAATAPVNVSGRRYMFPDNDQNIHSIELETAADGSISLLVDYGARVQRIACGSKAWRKSEIPHGLLHSRYLGLPDELVAASGGWTANDTYTAKICFYQTPVYLTAHLKFVGNELYVDNEYSVAFKEPKMPQLVGRAE